MKESATNPSRRKFDEDFKQSALKMIDNGQSVRSVAQALGVSENLLHKWKQARHANRSGLEAENAELRARLRQVEMERDILKKALSIFSRQS
jgi:transposase